MQYGTEFSRELTSLRRYARAISGSQEVGDDLIVATLEAMMRSPMSGDGLTTRAAIFQLLSRLWNTPAWAARCKDVSPLPSGFDQAVAADQKLLELPSLDRQAFLLVAMEQFSEQDASRVLDLAPSEFAERLDSARRRVASQIVSNILIIQDEPSIASDLEDIVTELGHSVVGIADTHQSAVELMHGTDVQLILADVQLADGSNGVDVIQEILKSHAVPVIFITAFPDRLFAGGRVEPTYLIQKPFRVQEIRAAVSQALFFAQRTSPTDSEHEKILKPLAV